MLSADRRGWGPGWPHNNADKCVVIKSKLSGTTLWVRREIAPLVKFAIDEVEARGYLYDHGPTDPLDDWSFVNRPIRGTNIASNHSWGLAFDLDATLYPQGQTKRRPPQWVDDIWRKYRFDNGAPWKNSDPMHYEFNGTPADAAFLVASLAAHHINNTEPPMPPSAPNPRRDEDVKVYKLIYPNRVEYWLGRSSGLATNLAPQDVAPLTAIYGTPVELQGEVLCSYFKNFNDELPFAAIGKLSEGATT